ncbi:hypothetical protein RHSIM_Rhsim12G0079800 [Rhododendron simsii]|uniref:Endonuclease/exonuclease/phosphatase domain-containing protein n=1 Tax=Rhododendron simsii TaxID=118357 RepID=A0A834L7Z7_RHOSS|nr:hypothetical protein RHSIM_Rhsim12G0079800 [Rhododendron simsii]
METKNKRDTLERIKKRLRFQGSCYVDPEGLSGDLALWWKEDVDVEIRSKSKNMIRCIMKWNSVGDPWLTTFIYAPPTPKERILFWNQLRSVARENLYPWLCVGDFNEVASTWEKEGGNDYRGRRIELFQELISDCGWMELEFKGLAFTWSNNQGGINNIRERLDRAMAKVPWRLFCPTAQVFHEGSAMFTLRTKLRSCQKSLQEWSKKTFGNNKKRIEDLTEKIRIIQGLPYCQEGFSQEQELAKELEITMLREEMYVHQRSRVNWLRFGDKNTAFFHATLMQRRQRNQLCTIKNGRGIWLKEESEIRRHLGEFFSNLFEASGERDFSAALNKSNCKKSHYYGYFRSRIEWIASLLASIRGKNRSQIQELRSDVRGRAEANNNNQTTLTAKPLSQEWLLKLLPLGAIFKLSNLRWRVWLTQSMEDVKEVCRLIVIANWDTLVHGPAPVTLPSPSCEINRPHGDGPN